nr:hypothetical protein [Tanacetum cinerariifolium]
MGVVEVGGKVLPSGFKAWGRLVNELGTRREKELYTCYSVLKLGKGIKILEVWQYWSLGLGRTFNVGHSKWLVALPNQNEKCLKPQAAYSFTPENRKKFCQFIKEVKLPDGFESCFKHKVADNDTNITGLKSHDCHIMMQRLVPYGLQNYLPDKIAKPIIELCSLFKQICSATLMEDDMLKAQIKVVDILYMKKLKGYVRNKAKQKGSIAEGYVAEEALTFSSYYFWDVTTKFNRPDRNVDPPPPTCQFQVFRSVCKSIGLWSVIRFDAQELKKVKWYVLHNSPEIDTYRSQFKSLFPNKDMKEEFPGWFGRSGICSPGPDEEMYYGQLQEIFEFKGEAFKNDQYILVTQVKQVLYLEDKAKTHLKVIEHVNHKKFSDGGVIVVEDDPDIIHFDNSSDLLLSTSLNDLDNATFPTDDSDDEDLTNVDDDGVDKV